MNYWPARMSYYHDFYHAHCDFRLSTNSMGAVMFLKLCLNGDKPYETLKPL